MNADELNFAHLDFGRSKRTGFGETVFGPGKTPEQLCSILEAFRERGIRVLCTKCSDEQAAAVAAHGISAEYDPVPRLLLSAWGADPPPLGSVAVCTGGTGDIPVAEEAARTCAFFGAQVSRFYDVGVAGLHRILNRTEAIRTADVVIVVAGMEGALGSVVSGLVSAPVIAVPTSVGYGANFQGLSALLAMINSCAEGMSVVNIDNGFGAAMMACRILHLLRSRETQS